jgi:hypothetical protein
MDEGHILAYADMLSKGGELYRDASLLPLPGAFYLMEIAFGIFGPSIRLARWIVLLEFACLTMVAFSLTRRISSIAAAWVGVGALLLYRVWAFPHWHMYSYSTTALVALAVGLLALVRFLETNRPGVLAAAGLATGLGILCKQDYGAAGWVAMNATLGVAIVTSGRGERGWGWRILFAYNAPVVAVGLLTAVHFLRQGLFLEVLRQTVLNHLIGIATFDYTSLPPILPLFEQEPLLRGRHGFTVYAPAILATVDWARISSSALYQRTVVWDLWLKFCFYAPYLVAAVSAVRMMWLRSTLSQPERAPAYLVELALSLYAIVLLAALSKPVDWIHLWVLCWPLICLAVVHVWALLQSCQRTRRVALALLLAPALGFSGYTFYLAWELRAQFTQPLHLERAGIHVRPNENRLMRETVSYAQAYSRPGEPFAVLPYFPLISFLAERHAPHPAAYVLWPVEDVPDRETEIIEALEAGRSDHLIYTLSQWIQFPRMEEFAPELFGYLVDHYEIDRVFRPHLCGGFEIVGLERSRGPLAGRSILAPAHAALRIETPGLAPRTIPAEGWDRFLRRERWPFREVVAVGPLECGQSVVVDVPVRVSEGSRLRTAVGSNPDHWCSDPSPSVTFTIRALVGGEARRLYSKTLDPRRRPKDRAWFEIDLSLDDLTKDAFALQFVTECRGEGGELHAWAGWEEPRILVPTNGDRNDE